MEVTAGIYLTCRTSHLGSPGKRAVKRVCVCVVGQISSLKNVLDKIIVISLSLNHPWYEQQQQQQQQPFNGCLSGSTRVGRYQKKHSPAHTHPGQCTSFITFHHLQRSTASSLFSLHAWQSSRTTSFQGPLWSSPWSWTLNFILHAFLHPIIIIFPQHMPIPTQPVLVEFNLPIQCTSKKLYAIHFKVAKTWVVLDLKMTDKENYGSSRIRLI